MAKQAQSFIENLLDKYSEDVIDIEEGKVDVIQTGSVSLDVSTGIGGIPKGRFTEIYGAESSGKTTLSLSVARNCIANSQKVLYVEPENSLDKYYVEAIIGGWEPSWFVLAQPETMEQALEICEMGIRAKEFGLVVLDSVGALAPEKEKEDDLGDAHVAQVAKGITPFLRRNAFEVRKSDTAFIFVNQIRDKIGGYGDTSFTPGGHALLHFTSLRIGLSTTAKANNIIKDEEILGVYIRFLNKKNKLARPFRSFMFPLVLGKGIDYNRDLVEFAEMLGILEKRGSYYVYEGETIGQGMLKTIENLEGNPELLDKLVKKVYNSVTRRKEGSNGTYSESE